jgi:hypothetical protein
MMGLFEATAAPAGRDPGWTRIASVQNETQSFVVRIWHEVVSGQGKEVVWRGSIDHVGADQRLYFADLDAAKRFIEERAGMAVRSRSRWAAFWARVRGWFVTDRKE